jgi:hypothetical protein
VVVCRRVMGPEGRHDQEIRLQRNAFHYLHRCPVHSSQQLEVDIGQDAIKVLYLSILQHRKGEPNGHMTVKDEEYHMSLRAKECLM